MADVLPSRLRNVPESVRSAVGTRVYVPTGSVPFAVSPGGAEPAKDRVLGTPQFLYLIFQLMRIAYSGRTGRIVDIKEVRIVSLAVLPNSIQYRYSSRNMISQTAERQGVVSGFRDVHGRELTEVNINGTFGQISRMDRSELKTGWDRLLEFREDIFKASLATTRRDLVGHPVAGRRKLTTSPLEQLPGGSGSQYFYAVNFFDFINEEQFTVDINSFNINESTDHNNLPYYTLSLKEVGPIVTEYTADGPDSELTSTELSSRVGGSASAVDSIQGIDFSKTVLDALVNTINSPTSRVAPTDTLVRAIRLQA